MKKARSTCSGLAAVVAAMVLMPASWAAYGAEQWEYQVKQVQAPVSVAAAEFLEDLYNEMGREGWEIVTIDRQGTGMLITFKRKKE